MRRQLIYVIVILSSLELLTRGEAGRVFVHNDAIETEGVCVK